MHLQQCVDNQGDPRFFNKTEKRKIFVNKNLGFYLLYNLGGWFCRTLLTKYESVVILLWEQVFSLKMCKSIRILYYTDLAKQNFKFT